MRALLSVYDKTGIAALGHGLVDLGYEVVSTGGTLAALEMAGVSVTAVSDVTGFPEILDGRLKTLHPHIHGGLLARRRPGADRHRWSRHDPRRGQELSRGRRPHRPGRLLLCARRATRRQTFS